MVNGRMPYEDLLSWHEPGTRIYHAGTPDGTDYTLCGFSLDGEDGDRYLTTSNRRINCDRCIAIIKFCKGIPARRLAPSPLPGLPEPPAHKETRNA